MDDELAFLRAQFLHSQRSCLYFAGNINISAYRPSLGIRLMSSPVAALTWLAWDSLIHLDVEVSARTGSLPSEYAQWTVRLGTACMEV